MMSNKEELLNNINKNIQEYCDTYFKFDFDPENPVIRVQETSYGAEEINAVMQTTVYNTTMASKSVISAKYADMLAQIAVVSNLIFQSSSVAALANPFH